MKLLQKNGVAAPLAQRLVSEYDMETEAKVQADPYTAVRGLKGGTFK